jgi:hypothetical protein
MTQIFIENIRLDISADISALLTFTIDDVRDFASRNTTFSKTIVLPGTARNNKAFGQVFDVRSSNPYDDAQANVNFNFNAAKRASAVIFQDQIQTFKGWLRLIEIVIDNGAIEYEVAVFGELYGFVTAMGSNKIENLDFSAYDEIWDPTAVEGSWAAPYGSGVVYPLIDYGTYSTAKKNWPIGTFRPAVFAKEIIDKIFTAAGYTYTCALFDTDRFKRLIVPHSQKALTKLDNTLLDLSRSSLLNVLNSGTSDQVAMQWFTAIGASFTITGTNSRFAYNLGTPATVTLNYSLAGTYKSNTQTFRLEIRKNGTAIVATQKNLAATSNVDSFWSWAGSETISFTSGDYIEFFATVNPSILDSSYLRFTFGTAKVLSDTSVPVLVTSGSTVKINDTLPRNILQRDFFSSILKLFNLLVIEDPLKSNALIITPYIDFYSGTPVDWTRKLDRSSPVRITPMANISARFFDFKFKDDSDYYNATYQKQYGQGYGSYTYDSAFDLENDRSTCEVIFSGTPLVGYAGEDKVYSTILAIEANVEASVNSNIRLLQFKNVTGVTSWNLIGGTTGLTNYGYAGHYDDPDAPNSDIQFGVPKQLYFTLSTGNVSNQQFNLYWSEYMAEITDKDSRLLTAKFKLDIADIINLDFGKLVYIDGALWRLNKIVDYNMSEPDLCTVSLLRVIEKEY